jgi:serine/threonine-protein kinase
LEDENLSQKDLDSTLQNASTTVVCPTCGLALAEGGVICPADGTIVDSADSTLQRIRDSYDITGVIASGGMGVVYKATHRILQKTVAIKMLKPGQFNETALLRFQREGKIASTLAHPNIVGVNDFGVTEFGQPFMIMEYVDGVSLAQTIRESGSLTVEATFRIATKACEALKFAHEKGVLHRDIKPTNIMLAKESGEVKIVDFGIAKQIEPSSDEMSLTESGASLGSPLYMSPEQSKGKKLDGRCDLYSLGCVIFECLTGAPPFVGKSAVETILLHLSEDPPTLREASLGRTYPEHVEELVSRLLAKDPEKRFQTADEFLQALSRQGNEAVSTAATETSAGSKFDYKFVAIAAGLVLVLTAGVVVSVFLKSDFKSEKTAAEKVLRPTIPLDQQKNAPPSTVPAAKRTDLNRYDRDVSKAIFMQRIDSSSLIINASGFDLRDEDLKNLKQDARLQAIVISDTGITDSGLAILAELKNLLCISANRTKITDTGIAKLTGMPKLHTLHLSETRLTDACTGSLARIVNLREVDLCDTTVSDKGIDKLARLKQMKSIHVNRTLVTDRGIEAIVKNFPALEELHARSNPGITAKSLKYLGNAHSLRRLTLSGCPISATEMRNFFARHPQIKEVASVQEKMFLDFIAP